jgi:hypothetical protein
MRGPERGRSVRRLERRKTSEIEALSADDFLPNYGASSSAPGATPLYVDKATPMDL